jgi:hypothetical protein
MIGLARKLVALVVVVGAVVPPFAFEPPADASASGRAVICAAALAPLEHGVPAEQVSPAKRAPTANGAAPGFVFEVYSSPSAWLHPSRRIGGQAPRAALSDAELCRLQI